MEPALVVFDLDGTLADTNPGVAASWHEVARRMGLPEPDVRGALSKGGSFLDAIREQFGLEGDDVLRAAKVMRDHYCSEGYLVSELFPGIGETVAGLHDRGVRTAVATMKLEGIARRMVSMWGLNGVLPVVRGADPEGVLNKADLIRMCIEESGASPEGTVMVGDTVDDMRGAEAAGVRFLAVTYGYGFTEERCRELGLPSAGTASDIPDAIRRLPRP